VDVGGQRARAARGKAPALRAAHAPVVQDVGPLRHDRIAVRSDGRVDGDVLFSQRERLGEHVAAQRRNRHGRRSGVRRGDLEDAPRGPHEVDGGGARRVERRLGRLEVRHELGTARARGSSSGGGG